MEAIRFQLLHASPSIIHFAGDLKYGYCKIFEEDRQKIKNLQLHLANRPTWMSASIHKGEEEIMLWVHKELIKMYPNLVTILVTRHPGHGRQLALSLKREGVNVALRSKNEKISPCISIYIVDTLGELKTLYRATPIAVVGGSFCSGLAGHNVSEAAAAGCAVLTGPHVGHFSNMISEMVRSDCSSILQVADKSELLEALVKLFSDPKSLEERRKAAERAFSAISSGVVHRVWNLVNSFVLNEATLKHVKSERI